MNLKNIVTLIKNVSMSYPTIQEFGESDIYEFMNSGEHKYPTIFLTIESITSDEYAQTLNATLFYVDRLLSNSSNKIDVQTVGLTTLKSIKEKLEEVNHINFTSVNYTPFTEKFSDLCAGVFAQCNIQVNDTLECDDYELGTLTIKEDGLYNVLGYNQVIVDITKVRTIGGKSGDITLGEGLTINDDNVLSAEAVVPDNIVNSIDDHTGNITLGDGLTINDDNVLSTYIVIPDDIVNSIDGETGEIGVGNGIVIDGGDIALDDNYIYCDGDTIYVKADGNDIIEGTPDYTTIKANGYEVIHSDGDSIDIYANEYTVFSSRSTSTLIANQFDENIIYNRQVSGKGVVTDICNGGEPTIVLQTSDSPSEEISNDIKIFANKVYFQDSEVRVLYKKYAKIKLHIYDVKGTEAPVYIFVSTDVNTESRVIDYDPQGAEYRYELETIFDIEYYSPLIKVTVISDTDGLWVSPTTFSYNDAFNADYHPSPISFIPYNHHGMSKNGYYAGFCVQYDMSAYDPDEEEIPELMNIQTAHLCYAEGTMITLGDGTKKAVENITYDDLLKVWNFDNGNIDSAYPLWIKKEEIANEYALVKLSNGNEIKLVGNDGKYHCLFDITEQKFNHAIDCIGHLVYTEDGISIVESLDIVKEPTKYYNIVTNVHLNCFANGILTSTEKNNIYPIDNMKYVYDNRKIVEYSVFEQYGISIEEYKGWRLGEQPMSVEECLEHIKLRNYYKK